MTDDNEEHVVPETTGFYSDSQGDMFIFDPEKLEKDIQHLTALLVSRQDDVKDGAGVALYLLATEFGKEYARFVASEVGSRYAQYMLETSPTWAVPIFQQNFGGFILAFRHLFGATEIPDLDSGAAE